MSSLVIRVHYYSKVFIDHKKANCRTTSAANLNKAEGAIRGLDRLDF
jgi:hypothetical protein